MQTLRRSRSNFSIKSKFSTHGQSDNWHRQVLLEAGDQHPIGLGYVPNASFPWITLRQITDSYLTKKRGKNTVEDRDACLTALIRNHAAKDIAVAACAHAMSPKAVRDLLTVDLNIKPGDSYGLPSYLQAIIAANHVNEGAVSALEAQRAIELMASSNASAGRYLEGLLQILINGVPANFLIHSHIQTLARLACVNFAAQVEGLRGQCQWRRAQAATEWLSRFVQRSVESLPENMDSTQILYANFPHWCAWANWNPDVARIGRWELFSPAQRATLANALALEGPDYISDRHATLREAVEARGFIASLTKHRVANIDFEVEQGFSNDVPDMVDRLLKLVDAAVVTSENDDTAILAYFCISQSVTNKRLDCLECLSHLADPSISALVSQAYRARNESWGVQMAAVMRLLPILGSRRCDSLRAAIGPDISSLVRGTLEEMQKILLSQIRSGQPSSDTEARLQACGSGLLETPWLWPSLDSSLVDLFKDWPTPEDIGCLQSIRDLARMSFTGNMLEVVKKVNDYLVNCLVKRGTINTGTRILMKALIKLWKQALDSDRRLLALSVVQGRVITTNFRCRCLDQLPQLEDGFVFSLRTIIQNHDDAPDPACVDLTTLLVTTEASVLTCWRPVLNRMLQNQGQKLIDYALANLKAREWVQFLLDIRKIFGEDVKWDPNASAPILNPRLHQWAASLDMMYMNVINELEADAQCGSTVQCILVGGDGPYGHLEETLERALLLMLHMEAYSKPAMMTIISLLERDGSNALAIVDALSSLDSATEQGCVVCLHVLDFAQNKPREVVEVILAGYLQAPDLTDGDQEALRSVAEVFDMRPGSTKDWSEAGLKVVTGYLDAEYAELFAEAQRLEEMRFLLKSIDPQGTSQMLASVGIEDGSAVDDALANLPPALMSVVEKVDDTRVEMLFPLTHLTQLQRLRFGLGDSQSLYLHFLVTDDPAFCIHLDIEMKGKNRVGHATSIHYPWQALPGGEEPDLPICQGQTSPTKYHLARAISRHLAEGFTSLEAIHMLVTSILKDLGKCCITCGRDHGVKARSPTTCSQSVCRNAFLLASLEVHLCQIRQDPAAVDFLLSMVYSAASTGNLQLLPNCPFNNTATVLQILNLLPSMSSLQNSDGMAEAIRALNPQVEQLLKWVCTACRGFISSAQGPLRIPSLPAGSHQFLLASHNPEHEAAFSRHLLAWNAFAQTRVLFHGTSLDRLFAITCEGLKVLSGTSLQAHGAASGAGVYCASEPSTSWGYCAGQGQGNWARSQFSNFRVLLGLENVGNSMSPRGVHVVKDATTLCVRYMCKQLFFVRYTESSISLPGEKFPLRTPLKRYVANSLKS
ncbi:hypothetical protein N431DRAFT_38267 [Stipitochalara longipes BDJ]|nr:hypothetical protein N431DRAFT_38267 [Stipitochalara longipes BDJ]